jgi:hypothetical protein
MPVLQTDDMPHSLSDILFATNMNFYERHKLFFDFIHPAKKQEIFDSIKCGVNLHFVNLLNDNLEQTRSSDSTEIEFVQKWIKEFKPFVNDFCTQSGRSLKSSEFWQGEVIPHKNQACESEYKLV